MDASKRALMGLAAASAGMSVLPNAGRAQQAEFPAQEPFQRGRASAGSRPRVGAFDMRDGLSPSRLTLAMWDQSFALRHGPGGSFEDYRRVLAETEDRLYNTVRIDPMPQYVDLNRPDEVHHWPDRGLPFVPWSPPPGAQSTPTGRWVIDFMETLLRHSALNYTLSAWWFGWRGTHRPAARVPRTTLEAAEIWAVMLRDWKRLFGFERLVYVDICNEYPFFAPFVTQRMQTELGRGWGGGPFTPEQATWIAADINPALAALRREFPELRFMLSIHGDERWLDVPVEHDCLDVHFYADADPRWDQRTRFGEISEGLFRSSADYAEFSRRAQAAAVAMAPMSRARQRAKLASFATLAETRGMPLTTSESWASWFYIDHPDLDWGWLLDWAARSVEDAIDYRMWGWTPHNYVQPQFSVWRDARWHRTLNERFLRS